MPTQLDRIEEKLVVLQDKHETTAETCIRIDERTVQHEKRMDRTDRRSGIFGGLAGAFVAGFAFVASKFG